MKKSLHIGVFNPALINQASPYCGDNVFAKGLELNGYEVTRFDYRATQSPDVDLINLANQLDKDLSIVWMGKCERIAPETIDTLRSIFPEAIFVKWAADVRDEPTQHDLAHNSKVDWFFGTFGGDYLKKHLLPNMKGVASIITFTDSTYYTAEEVDDSYCSDILWTGRRGFGDNPVRNEVIDTLLNVVDIQSQEAKNDNHLNIKMFGHDGRTWVGHPDYVKYINGTKVGIGSNSFNRRKYSSDRLGNYMACGTFYLTQYIEGLEEVFTRGTHLDWFSTPEEMSDKIKFYLENPTERYKIAQAGRQFILDHFDAKPLTLTLLRIIETGKKQNAWEDVYVQTN